MTNRGGQANEAGSTYRAGVATFVAVFGLIGRPVGALEYHDGQHPVRIEFESTDPVDDLTLTTADGNKAYFQCKRRCGRDQALRDSLRQVIEHCELNGYDDRLVIASAEFVGDVRALPTALRKRRTGGTPSAGEKKALKAVQEQLQTLTDTHIESVLDALHAWQVDASDPMSRDYEVVAGWVSTILSKNIQVEAAIGVIKAYLHNLAGTAAVSTIADLWKQLSSSGIRMQEDLTGTPVQRLAAKHQLVKGYELRVAEHCDTILPPVACAIPTLQISGFMAQIKGTVDSDPTDANDSTQTRPLLDITRRLKRYVLHGGPGAGKSTAVQQLAAAFASDPDAPIPITVRLRKLATRVEHESDVTLGLLLSCADHLTEDPDLLMVVEEVARNGGLLIILDGVDECRTATRHVLTGLTRLLNGLLRDNGIIVTTRPSVLEQVKHLGLVPVALEAPASPEIIPKALIHALSARRPEEERKTWQAAKIQTLEPVLAGSEQLSQVPLLAMTIAILIATEESSQTVAPASILEKAVKRGIEEWERQRVNGSLIDYDNDVLTPAKLLDAYICIGYCIARSGPVALDNVIASVSEVYESKWKLSPPEAKEMAKHAVIFWDERMSIFVVNESNVIEPRARQFAELADALWVTAAGNHSKRQWITNALEDESMIDSAMLAIGKDDNLASLFLSTTTNQPRALEWVSTFGRGNSLPKSTVRECLVRLSEAAVAVSREQELAGVNWEQLAHAKKQELRDGPRWPFLLTAARLRCPPELRETRDSIVARAENEDERAIAVAFAAITDATVDDRALSGVELERLEEALQLPIPESPKPRVEEGRRPVFHLISGEPLLTGRVELVGCAVRFVDQFTPQIAQLAEQYAARASILSGLHDRILQVLEKAGFPVTRSTVFPSLPKNMFKAPDGRRWTAHEMDVLGHVATDGATLSSPELWWATELLDLIDLMKLGSESFSSMDIEVGNKRGDDLTALAVLFCLAADIRKSNVRGIIDHIRDTSGDEGLNYFMGLGYVSRPTQYQPALKSTRIDLDLEHSRIVRTLCSPVDFIARSACRLIWDRRSDSLSEELLEKVENGDAHHLLWVCAAATQLASDTSGVLDQLLSLDIPEVTHAAALIAKNADPDVTFPATRQLQIDDDLTIRVAAGAPADRDADAKYWRCKHCWQPNDVGDEDCRHCDTGTRPTRKTEAPPA